MKIGGISITPPPEEMIVIPRGNEQLVFRATALPDMDEFDKLCPEPKAPMVLTKDGSKPNLTDKNYLQVMKEYEERRLAFLVVRSLEPSEIEWSEVDVGKPGTWTKWSQELREAGLTQVEVNRVFQLVIDANSLSEEKLERARRAFLLGQVLAQNASSGQTDEQKSTQSGEPASESESDPQK